MSRTPKADPYALPPGAAVRLLEIDCEAYKKLVLTIKIGRKIYVQDKKIQLTMQGCHFPLHPLLMSYWRGYRGERHKFFIPEHGVFFFYEINLVLGWIRHLIDNLPMTEVGEDRALMVLERLTAVEAGA